MPLKESVTEIPDSEDEPLSSSPVKPHLAPHELQASKDDSKQRESFAANQENAVNEDVPTDMHPINDSPQPDLDIEVTSSNAESLPEQDSPQQQLQVQKAKETTKDRDHVEEAHNEDSDIEPATIAESETPTITTEVRKEDGQEGMDQNLPPTAPPEVARQATPEAAMSTVAVPDDNEAEQQPEPALKADEREPEPGTIERKDEEMTDAPAVEAQPAQPENPVEEPGALLATDEPDERQSDQMDVDIADPHNEQQADPNNDTTVTPERESPVMPTEETGAPPATVEQIEKPGSQVDVDVANPWEGQLPDQEPSSGAHAVQGLSNTVDTAKAGNSRTEIEPPDVQNEARTGTKPAPKASTPAKNSQEATIAELKAQRAALIAALSALPTFQALLDEDESSRGSCQESDSEPTEADIMAAANKSVKRHIKLLHEYNEMKDAGQGLMGLIADQRGVRIVEIQDEFGIEDKD